MIAVKVTSTYSFANSLMMYVWKFSKYIKLL